MYFATLILLCFIAGGCSRPPSYIRVRNANSTDLRYVQVMTNVFGTIKAGEISSYQSVGSAYNGCGIWISPSNAPVTIDKTLLDQLGPRLSPGRYTYVLRLTNGAVDATVLRDP